MSKKIGPAINGKASPLIPETAPATRMPATAANLPTGRTPASEDAMSALRANPSRSSRPIRLTRPRMGRCGDKDAAEPPRLARGSESDVKLMEYAPRKDHRASPAWCEACGQRDR